MKLVHMAYKARKLCIHSAMSAGQQYSYGCVQLCNKAGELLKELLPHADSCYQTNTLAKVCLLSLSLLVLKPSFHYLS